MKSNIFTMVLIVLLTSRVSGQASSSSLAQAFDSLGASRIYNEIMIPDPLEPKVAVLYYMKGADSGSISLLSISSGKVRTEWHLSRIPQFMEAIDPANLRVTITDDGPVILLHGCAAHLCGGHGVAGALVYSIAENELYTEAASWSDSTHSTEYVYSPPGISTRSTQIKQLLDALLRDEGYNP